MSTVSKQYSLWPSVVRILATFLIFYFHFGAITDAYYVHKVDRFAIFLFLVISGYFSYSAKGNEVKWLVRRFKNILLPYWPLALGAIVLNHLIDYKSSTYLEDGLVFFGLSLFLDDPIYIISWFITLILFFYLNLFFFRIIKNRIIKSVFWVLSFYLFYTYLKASAFYYIGFYIGYYLCACNLLKYEPYLKIPFVQNLNRLLFNLQSYCYVFFLVHGAIVLFHVRILKWNNTCMFLSALVGSLIASYLYKQLLDRTIMKIRLG